MENRPARHLPRPIWKLLSVSIYVKILGIGGFAALLFSVVLVVQTQTTLRNALHRSLADQTLSSARLLALTLGDQAASQEPGFLSQRLQSILESIPDAGFVIVRDPRQRLVAGVFADKAARQAAAGWSSAVGGRQEVVETLPGSDGLLLGAWVPIAGGSGGSLQLSISDTALVREVSGQTRSLVLVLFLCTLVGSGFGLLFTSILTRPVSHLVSAANRIQKGDFTARADIYTADEIGRLGHAFNDMAASLGDYRREVERHQQARQHLLGRIVQAQEEERRAISRELHDEIGQSLSALLLTVHTNREADNQDPALWDDIESRVRRVYDDIHRLAWGMRPPLLDDYGLDGALQRFVEEMSDRSGLPIDYQYHHHAPAGQVPQDIELTLYRVAQEAITNVVRHAGATQANVVLLQSAQEITLLIEDDGCGFDTSSVNSDSHGGMGLSGIRERVALFEGNLVIESESGGGGSTIRAQIPLG